jgi:hypothetical protein
VTVATSATSASPLELRVTDATVTYQQVREFCEKMEHLFATANDQIIAAGTLIG